MYNAPPSMHALRRALSCKTCNGKVRRITMAFVAWENSGSNCLPAAQILQPFPRTMDRSQDDPRRTMAPLPKQPR
jgi:hypothetical protein